MAPFHIKAQVLRQRQLEPMAALGVFDPRADASASSGDSKEATKKASWRQADLKRMIAAAEQAGLASYRVEVAPDGTLSIVVGSPSDTAANAGDAATDHLFG